MRLRYVTFLEVLSLIIFLLSCNNTQVDGHAEMVEIVGMPLEVWQERVDEAFADSRMMLALAAQQMPGLSGLYIENQSLTVIVRSPVPEGGFALPSDSPYPPLEGAVPIMERSSANIRAMLKLMYGEDTIYAQFPFEFKQGVYEARQLLYWMRSAGSLLADVNLEITSSYLNASRNRIEIGIEDINDAPEARAALVAGGIPDDALEIVEVRVRPLPEFD